MSSPVTDAPAVLTEIVVATDFSASSEAALLYSLGIARQNNARVWIVHVVGDSFFSADTQQHAVDDAWREGHRRLTEYFITGRLDGVSAKLVVEQGSISDVLQRIVDEKHANLLVVGTRGRSRIGKLLLGSAAESIFRQASCPVLTVGPGTEVSDKRSYGPKKILFAAGFSMHSLKASELSLHLAERQGAELLLLHVGPESESTSETYKSDALHRLQALVPAGSKLTVPPKTLLDFGIPSERILSVANEYRPDLIVLGVRQPEGFARRVRWATAYDVVSNARCPVLTVRS